LTSTLRQKALPAQPVCLSEVMNWPLRRSIDCHHARMCQVIKDVQLCVINGAVLRCGGRTVSTWCLQAHSDVPHLLLHKHQLAYYHPDCHSWGHHHPLPPITIPSVQASPSVPQPLSHYCISSSLIQYHPFCNFKCQSEHRSIPIASIYCWLRCYSLHCPFCHSKGHYHPLPSQASLTVPQLLPH
jgi:hypothetical protein